MTERKMSAFDEIIGHIEDLLVGKFNSYLTFTFLERRGVRVSTGQGFYPTDF